MPVETVVKQSLPFNQLAVKALVTVAKKKRRGRCRVLDLDISDLRIRDIGMAISPVNFPSLTDLRIAQNSLTSIHGLIGLPRLTALNADGNRLGSGNAPLFSPQPAIHATAMAGVGDSVGEVGCGDPSMDARPDVDAVEAAGADKEPVSAAGKDVEDGVVEDVVLPALQVLQLGDNRLMSIDMLGVSRLTGLRSLFLQNNQIARVDGLAALSFLEELVCKLILKIAVSLQHKPSLGISVVAPPSYATMLD